MRQGVNSDRKTVYRLIFKTSYKSVIDMNGSTYGLTGIFFDEKLKNYSWAIEWVNSNHPQASNICSSMCVVFN